MDDFEGLDNTTNAQNAPTQTTALPTSGSSNLEGLEGPANASTDGITSTPSDFEGLDGSTSTTTPTSSLATGINNSPIGWAGWGAQKLEEGIGAIGNGIGNAYDWATGTPTASTAAIANAPKTIIEGAIKAEQVPENLVKRGLGWMEGLDTSQEVPNQTTIPGQAPSYHDILFNAPGIKDLDPASREAMAKNLGAVGELVGDPMWFLHLGGLTASGKEAVKAGMLELNIAKAGQAGQRAALTLGNTPIVSGKPILNAIGAVQTGLRKAVPGFHTMTEDPEFNHMAEERSIAPDSYSHHISDEVGDDLNKTINDHAKQLGTTPLELNRRMMDYREPPGSQNQLPDDLNRSAFAKQIDKISDIHKSMAEQQDKVSSLVDPIDNARLNLMESMGNQSHDIVQDYKSDLQDISDQLSNKSNNIKQLADESKGLKQKYDELVFEHSQLPDTYDRSLQQSIRASEISKSLKQIESKRNQINSTNDDNLMDLHDLRERQKLKQKEIDQSLTTKGLAPSLNVSKQTNQMRSKIADLKQQASIEMANLDSLRQGKEAESNNLEGMNQRLTAIQQAMRDKQSAIGESLPPALRQIADTQIKTNRGYLPNEGIIEDNDYYLHHTGTPEWKNFKDEHFNDQSKESGSSAPKSDQIAAHDERGVKMTAREANYLFQTGHGDKVFPNSKFPNTLKTFRKPIFSENIANIEANRFLQNSKVNRVSDFMEGAKQFSIPESKLDKNPKKLIDYAPVKSDHYYDTGGERWFPKDHADFINGLQNPKLPEMNQGWFKNFLQGTSTLTKLVNFGLKPASAPFNYASNLNLAFLNHLLSLKNVAKGLAVIIKHRFGKLDSNKKVIYSPRYKKWINEKELMDRANKHRAIGMGIQRSEIANAQLPNKVMDSALIKGAMAYHMFAEDASRLPVYMTALERGGTWEGAAKQTREAEYDYSDLGKNDKKIAQYIPFYRFARLNMPKMVERMISDPARSTLVPRATQAWNQSQGQQSNENDLAGYHRESEPVYVGKDAQGKPIWVDVGRYMTQYDPNKVVGAADDLGEFHPVSGALKYAAGMVNPFLKTPIEEAANENFANNVPIAQDTHANGGLGEFRDVAPGLPAMPAKIAYALNQLSPFSMARTAADQTIPLEYRALHELGGINAYAQQPEVDQTYKGMAVKKQVNNLEYAIKLFARKYASDDADGNTKQAEIDKRNLEDAIKEAEKLTPQAVGALQ